MPWSANDVVGFAPQDHRVVLLDLFNGHRWTLPTAGHILAMTTSHVLIGTVDGFALHTVSPSPSTVTVRMEARVLSGLVFDMHIFCLTDTAVCIYDLFGAQVVNVPVIEDEGERVILGQLFVSPNTAFLGSVGLVAEVERADERWIKSFRIDRVKAGSEVAVLLGRIKERPGHQLLRLLPQLHHTITNATGQFQLVAAVYEDGTIVRFDWHSLKIDKTGELKTGIVRILNRDILVKFPNGGLGLFGLGSLQLIPLVLCDTFNQNNIDVDPEDPAVGLFVSDCGSFLLALKLLNGILVKKIWVSAAGLNGADLNAFAVRLLSPDVPFRVANGWFFRIWFGASSSDDQLFAFLLRLITIASEIGKGSQLGAICRALAFVARFMPGSDPRPFDLLNDLDRTVSLATAMTANTEQVIMAVEQVMNGGDIAPIDSMAVPDDQMHSITPLITNLLERCQQEAFPLGDGSLESVLMALASFRRRLVTLCLFAATIASQFDQLASETTIDIVKEFAIEQRNNLSTPMRNIGSEGLVEKLRQISAAIGRSFTPTAAGKQAEHELSATILFCLIRSTGLHQSLDFSTILLNKLPPTRASMPVGRDRIRGISLTSSAVTCRLCLGKSLLKVPELVTAKWNENYQQRCVCGGDWGFVTVVRLQQQQ